MPTLRDFLREARERLAAAGAPEPRLEAEVMLSDALGAPRLRLYAAQDEPLPDATAEALESVMRRRVRREPLAYVLGHREFYGVDLSVGPAVMVPRPETELLVERAMLLCMERMDAGRPVVVDVGTGAGGIAINLALHLPRAEIYATELSEDALAVAEANIRRHGVGERVALLQGDLLEPVARTCDVIVANLPYVPSGRLPTLQPELAWEPSLALDGGENGLAVIRRLVGQAALKLAGDGVVLLEIDPGQSEPLSRLAGVLFPDAKVSVEKDLAGLERVFMLEDGSRHGGE